MGIFDPAWAKMIQGDFRPKKAAIDDEAAKIDRKQLKAQENIKLSRRLTGVKGTKFAPTTHNP